MSRQRHQEALVEIARRRALAEEATLGPWSRADEIDGIYAGRRTVVRAADGLRVVSVGQTRRHHGKAGEANAAHIAANDPAHVLAALDTAEAALRRHAPKDSAPWLDCCAHCLTDGWEDDCVPANWPCPDAAAVLDLFAPTKETAA